MRCEAASGEILEVQYSYDRVKNGMKVSDESVKGVICCGQTGELPTPPNIARKNRLVSPVFWSSLEESLALQLTGKTDNLFKIMSTSKF